MVKCTLGYPLDLLDLIPFLFSVVLYPGYLLAVFFGF